MVTIRKARQEDGEEIWRTHAQAIRKLCKSHYTPEEIEVWAGRFHPDSYQGAINSREFFVAEDQGRIVGFGQLCLESGEVEAVYVHPNAARRGIGTQLSRKLEERAEENGVTSLHLDASLNAVPFYTKAGFISQREAKHQLQSGVEITCVVMTKMATG